MFKKVIVNKKGRGQCHSHTPGWVKRLFNSKHCIIRYIREVVPTLRKVAMNKKVPMIKKAAVDKTLSGTTIAETKTLNKQQHN